MHEGADNCQAVQRLREAGLLATGARVAILEALASDRRHPTAEMLLESLHARIPSLSMSTVYATLESFLQRGLIHRITGTSGRLRVDGTKQNHDHAVCRNCGDVFDIDRDWLQRPKPPRELPHGLQVTNLHIQYEVVCPSCQRDGQ
jgi:Fe2+ or Zn2+ uptake regulation protein